MNSGINVQQQVSANGFVYSYTVKAVTISNALGQEAATLTEYKLESNAGDTILLYKTKEGSWYEMKQSDSPLKKVIMQALKAAIDQKESTNFSG